jgi:hypothetical protein
LNGFLSWYYFLPLRGVDHLGAIVRTNLWGFYSGELQASGWAFYVATYVTSGSS